MVVVLGGLYSPIVKPKVMIHQRMTCWLRLYGLKCQLMRRAYPQKHKLGSRRSTWPPKAARKGTRYCWRVMYASNLVEMLDHRVSSCFANLGIAALNATKTQHRVEFGHAVQANETTRESASKCVKWFGGWVAVSGDVACQAGASVCRRKARPKHEPLNGQGVRSRVGYASLQFGS